MREHEVNKLDNFIMGWYMDDTSLCDRLIDYFENRAERLPGISAKGVDESFKKSTDALVLEEPLVKEYGNYLEQYSNLYKEKYPACNSYAPWRPIQYLQIQKYKPSEAFYGWHTERSEGDGKIASRHLVFMTYLNNVTDGGETEWMHQEIKIKPEKGLTIIWPVDWTFTHRGLASPTQDKYILTGWFNFIPRGYNANI